MVPFEKWEKHLTKLVKEAIVLEKRKIIRKHKELYFKTNKETMRKHC